MFKEGDYIYDRVECEYGCVLYVYDNIIDFIETEGLPMEDLFSMADFEFENKIKEVSRDIKYYWITDTSGTEFLSNDLRLKLIKRISRKQLIKMLR